jgi:hypothetical protein
MSFTKSPTAPGDSPSSIDSGSSALSRATRISFWNPAQSPISRIAGIPAQSAA